MCGLCRSQPCVLGDPGAPGSPPSPEAAVAATSGSGSAVLSPVPTGTPTATELQALFSGQAWSGGAVSFGFAAGAADYLGGSFYSSYNEPAQFVPLSSHGQDIVRDAVSLWQGVAALDIAEATAGSHPQINIGGSVTPKTAWAYYPGSTDAAGDIWFGLEKPYFAKLVSASGPYIGSYEYVTALHEFGHALGLKHPHQGAAILDPAWDGLEYTVMSYRSYSGGPQVYTAETWGYPQSLMMLDIAAIQALYGADYATLAGDTTYRFDPLTGEMKVDGVSAGVPGGNRVFRTLWDGNGTDTIDLSAYATDLDIDLNPGKGIDLNVTGQMQRVRLGTDAAGAAVYAAHHIYMSLLWNGDTRSLIENATGGIGDDTLTGNQAANVLDGGAGDDFFTGGLGADRFVFGVGADTVTDTLAGLDGDTIADFDLLADRILVEGATLAPDMVTYDVLTGRLAIDVGSDGLAEAVLHLGTGLGTVQVTLAAVAGGTEIRLSPAAIDSRSNPPAPATTVTLTDTANIYTDGSGADLIVFGLGGNDKLTTGSGADTLWGGTGNDTLSGMAGNDTLRGEAGTDTLWGGDGTDTLWGGSENDKLYGETGNDQLQGEAGADTLDGGDGNDLLWGDAGADTLSGGEGDDTLRGGSENDKLYGDAGNDLLESGAGTKDYMTGGPGSDRFVFDAADFAAGAGFADYVTDYTFGEDTLKFSGFAASALSDFAPRDTTSGLRLTLGAKNYVYLTGVTLAQIPDIGVVFDDASQAAEMAAAPAMAAAAGGVPAAAAGPGADVLGCLLYGTALAAEIHAHLI